MPISKISAIFRMHLYQNLNFNPMQNPQQILIETQFEGLILYVRPDEKHTWLMETRLVAEGYGVSESTIREHKRKSIDELIENKHFTSVSITDAGGLRRINTYWTKRGVIRLGFFIKSERARLFRDWAEDLIIRELEKREEQNHYLNAIVNLEKRMFNYLDALNDKINRNHIEVKELIHKLTIRVDKIEAHLFKPHQIEERAAYVYLIRKVGKNEYKLGKSIDPLGRIADFEAANESFELLATIRFKSEAQALLWEATFKNYFASRQIKGEWFAFLPAEVALIIDLAKAFERNH